MLQLSDIPICVVTRFSFFGSSGWKSEFSQSADLLFDKARLARRLELFSAISLPSLVAQDNQQFHHLIITSELLPDWAMQKLESLLQAAYSDPSRFSIVASPPTVARKPLRLFLRARFGAEVIAQVVLDDDGLAADYMSTLRAELAALTADPPEDLQPWPYFISYAKGYGLVFSDTDTAPQLFFHRYPYINAGLTLIGSSADKNILSIDHRAAPKKFGSRLVHGAPMFLRSVHDTNDSRVEPSQRWQKIENWATDKDLSDRFPGLFDPGVFWNDKTPDQSTNFEP